MHGSFQDHLYCIGNFFREKVYITPQLWSVDYITPNLWNGLYHPPNFPKPVKLPHKAVLKNYSKSQKNYKIKNPIVLDSKWVDLHSEYIIWYALVYFFAIALDLYVHCVDLLIWSPTQLSFSFYDFSVINYDFLKLL